MDALLNLPAFVSELSHLSANAPVVALAILGILILWLAALLLAPKF